MFAKNYHLHWIAGRANILSEYIICIFFNFGCGFYGCFSVLFPKAPASCKNFERIFAALCLYIYYIQKVSQIFKILFQTRGDIYIFVHRGVFFSRNVQL